MAPNENAAQDTFDNDDTLLGNEEGDHSEDNNANASSAPIDEEELDDDDTTVIKANTMAGKIIGSKIFISVISDAMATAGLPVKDEHIKKAVNSQVLRDALQEAIFKAVGTNLSANDHTGNDVHSEPFRLQDKEAMGLNGVVNKKQLIIKDRLRQLDGIFPMDEEAVLDVLPEGSTFLSVEHFGTSAWSITGRVLALDAAGEAQIYFIKVAFEDRGKTMLRGEYESSKIVYSTMKDFLPKPYGFGRYKVQDPPTYFYLSEFVDMDITTAPKPAEFTKKLAQLHKFSESPTGKFGFAVPTCDGQVAHMVEWQDSWAEFYRRLLLAVCEQDIEINGPWPKMQRATKQVADVVIPRLLGPLQENGKQLKPCIIHGDLWEGNVGISRETGDIILFDVGSYFAHNEMELGPWRCEFSPVFRSEVYRRHYLSNFPASEPASEFDDRNRLYSLKGAINYSVGHPGCMLRKTAYNNMCYLCEKYAPIDGIDKYDPSIDPSITGAEITPHLAEGLV